MSKWLAPALVVAMVLAFGWQCRKLGQEAEQAKQERAVHDSLTAKLTTKLRRALGHRDTLVDTVKVQVGRIAHATAQVETAKRGVDTADAAVKAADASKDSGRMIRTRDSTIAARNLVIATQDTLIGEVRDTAIAGRTVQVRTGLRGHVATLTEIVAHDTTVFRLFQSQRATDSSYIKQLQRGAGWSFLGHKLPKPKCGPGPAVMLYPKQAVGFVVACVLTL